MLFQTEFIFGTYQKIILGFVIVKNGERYSFVNTFSEQDQQGSLQCLASSSKFLAVGSSDETIALYDLEERHSSFCIQSQGEPKCMTFTPDGSYLMVGGNNGLLSMYRTGSWCLEKRWTGAHGGNSMIAVACHASSKLAISLGHEGTIQAWNLVKGRLAYTKCVPSAKGFEIHKLLETSPSGEYFAVTNGNYVAIYVTSKFQILYTFRTEFLVTCISFLNDETLCVGISNGSIEMWNFQRKEKVLQYTLHASRIKGIVFIPHETESFMVSASNDGVISLWKLQNKQIMALCKSDTRCRITCVSSYNIETKGGKKIESPTAEECIKKSRRKKAADQSTSQPALNETAG